VVVGAIGDYGTAVSQDKNGKPDLNGVFEKFTLKQGGFTVDATVLDEALGKVKPKVWITPRKSGKCVLKEKRSRWPPMTRCPLLARLALADGRRRLSRRS
jgi:hypothetical protein